MLVPLTSVTVCFSDSDNNNPIKQGAHSVQFSSACLALFIRHIAVVKSAFPCTGIQTRSVGWIYLLA